MAGTQNDDYAAEVPVTENDCRIEMSQYLYIDVTQADEYFKDHFRLLEAGYNFLRIAVGWLFREAVMRCGTGSWAYLWDATYVA
jgi:hypothetical protein